MLLSNMQRTKIESKSQRYLGQSTTEKCCYQICKELKLKANHNKQVMNDRAVLVVIKYAKN